MKLYRSFILILTFLTRIPVPMNFEFNQEDFENGFKLFPFIGAIVGFIICIPLLLIGKAPNAVIAFLIIIVYLLTVGGLHIDGVSDVFDGIFSARKKEKMLVIMEDSRIGAFGAIGLILYFLGIYIGLSELLEAGGSAYGAFLRLDLRVVAVFLMPIVGRSMALIAAGFSRYAKEGGMGKSLIDKNTKVTAVSLIVFLLLIGFFFGYVILFAILITLILGLFINYRIHKTLDGITGDVVGLIVEVSQVIFLLAIVVLI